MTQVWLSYWIQSGLVLLGFITTILWILFVPYVYIGVKAIRHGREAAWKQMESARGQIRRQGSPLVAALIELHKTQCFFMVSGYQSRWCSIITKNETETEILSP